MWWDDTVRLHKLLSAMCNHVSSQILSIILKGTAYQELHSQEFKVS